MNIIVTNKLTSVQFHDAKNLIKMTKDYDNTRGMFFLEDEMNAIREFPCYYMMYNGSTLISMISIFLPNYTEAELYAVTLPEFRKKGGFKRLFEAALNKLNESGIKNIFLVNDPTSINGEKVLTKIGAILRTSDYLMKYDMKKTPTPKNILRIEETMDGNTCEFKAYLYDNLIGHSYCEHSRGTTVIFGFYIEPEFRNKGYGKELLLLIIEKLIEEKVSKILLHVNGANIYAHRMYYHNGFINEEQIDYWEYRR